ncbi:hypothetical protein [Fodinicola acaciae]|uniref:hypothetical protein n=1 Tax=Fodinicola acaciae TaxID=2681555 RepID=UPI0013D39E93|nr:hypothetical protein [Fodinicola acaciae]
MEATSDQQKGTAVDTWTKVPVGLQAARWRTIQPKRTVLVVVHTVTTATRLLDVLPIFESDLRVQVVFTTPGHSAVSAGVDTVLADLGAAVIPWTQALHSEFDLAIAAAHSGNLHEINAPVVLLSHGIGYTKNSPGNRQPATGNRQPATGNRATYGLSPQWLLHDGQPYAAAIALPHSADLARLAEAVPQAVDSAVVVGDPCHDRIIASAGHRDRFRRAFGVTRGQRLIVVSSTWWERSLFGTWPEFFRQLLAELDLDRDRVAAVMHPHVWYAHGHVQLRSWLADCQRAGLILVPPLEGWRAALIAADCVVGDHGAVTTYATALDKPLALAAFPAEDVAAGTPVELLGRNAPRLHAGHSLADQIERTIADFRPGQWKDLAEMITSAPGAALRRLRATAYRLMELDEPAADPPLHLLPVPSTSDRPGVTATYVTGTMTGNRIQLVRRPADVYSGLPLAAQPPQAAHLVCHADHPVRALVDNADIVFCHAEDLTGSVEDALDRLRAAHPGSFATAVVGGGRCFVRTREKTVAIDVPAPFPAEAAVSALWFDTARDGVTVSAGDLSCQLILRDL